MGVPIPQDVDFLEHFGVKGMRWGVRKDRQSGVSRTKQGYANRKDRKANRIERRADRTSRKNADYQEMLNRIATGKKTAQDVATMWNTTTLWDIGTAVANRESIGKSYARNRQQFVDRSNARVEKKRAKAEDIRAHAERIRTGNSTTKDLLKFYGNTRLIDTIRG